MSRYARVRVTLVILPFVFWCSSACPGTEAVIPGFEDVAVVGEPVEQSGGHLGVAKHPCPFAAAEVGGDDDAGALVEFAE